MLEIERRSTRSHSVEKSLGKSLWTCRRPDYVMVVVVKKVMKMMMMKAYNCTFVMHMHPALIFCDFINICKPIS
jgi:hypothetical protein